MLQPCSMQRVAQGPAAWIGAIDNVDDLRVVCAWIERGRWEHDVLPGHLRLMPPASRRAVVTN